MDPFIGEIVMFGGNFSPRGWAYCDGQLLSIASNTALFSILGTTYGGDGRTTFALPDLRGRAPIHPGTGPGLSTYRLGQRGGNETTVLNVTNMPSHSHIAAGTAKASYSPPSGGATLPNPSGNNFSGATGTNIYSSNPSNVTMAADNIAVTVGSTGGSMPFGNMQPYLAVNFIIATVGIFPSRN